jgi:hypothetical protein
MATERAEKRDTEHALIQVFDYISPGTNEGISFSLSRLTEDLFVDSFLAGGDISLFTPSGRRGAIRSQLSNGDVLSSSAGAPARFPVSLQVDLNTGTATGDWTLPDGTAQTPSFELQHVKTVNRPAGTLVLFVGETTSDDGLYSLALLLI